jgi:cell division protein FtsQ
MKMLRYKGKYFFSLSGRKNQNRVPKLNKNKPQRTKKAKRNWVWKKKKNKRFFKILFLLSFILLVWIFILHSPLFRVRSIEISGNVNIPQNEVFEVLDIRVGDQGYILKGLNPLRWFVFRSLKLEQRLKQRLPYLSEASVRGAWFGRVLVQVKERKPLFLVPKGLRYWVLDKEGIVLEEIDPIARPKLPIFQEVTVSYAALGEKILFEEPYIMEHTKDFLEFVRQSDETDESRLSERITEISFSRIDVFSFTIDGRIRVILGDVRNLSAYKISFVKEIYFNQLSAMDKGSLDVSGEFGSVVFTPE